MYWQLKVILWSAREFRSLSSWWFLTDELSAYSRVFVLLVPEWLTLYFVLLNFILLLFLSISRLSDSFIAISRSSSVLMMHPSTDVINTCALVRSLIKIQPLPCWDVSELDQEKLLPYFRLIVPFFIHSSHHSSVSLLPTLCISSDNLQLLQLYQFYWSSCLHHGFDVWYLNIFHSYDARDARVDSCVLL